MVKSTENSNGPSIVEHCRSSVLALVHGSGMFSGRWKALLSLHWRWDWIQTHDVGGGGIPTEDTRAVIERAIYLGMDNYELIVDELLAEDVVTQGPGGDDFGQEAYKRRQAQFLDAFTDMEWTVDDGCHPLWSSAPRYAPPTL